MCVLRLLFKLHLQTSQISLVKTIKYKSLHAFYYCVELYKSRIIQQSIYSPGRGVTVSKTSVGSSCLSGVSVSIEITNLTKFRCDFWLYQNVISFSINPFLPSPTIGQCHKAESFVMEVQELTTSESTTHTDSCANDNNMKENSGKRKTEDAVDPDKSNRKKRRGGGGKKLRPGERYVPPPQKRNPGVSFSQEHFEETSYYFEGGLRKVYPYHFDFKTYCKGRWIGKSLLEVFSSEFRVEPLDYYKKAAKEGRIRLNETPVDDLSITLKNNDFLRNTVHRHEPPVSGRPLEILEDNEEVVVVDKPSSMPVHPCGRFRHNTVIFILGKEKGICGLHTVHRLDRLTSGVLLFARTLKASQKLDQMVRERQLEKEYVCRVEGEFPEVEVVCEEPILVVSFKVGLCRVDPKGKECRTVFQRLSWNGHSSVVRCLPLTGRTHQIRVHLQFLGYPILNDPIYGSTAWGPDRAKGGLVGMSDDQLLEALLEEHRSKESLHLLDIDDVGVTQRSGGQAGVNGGVGGSGHPPNISDETCSSPCEESASGASSQICNSNTSGCESNNQDESINASEMTTGTASVPVCDSSTNCAAPEHSKTAVPTEKEMGNSKDSVESSNIAKAGTIVKDALCSECKIVRPDPTEKELIMYLHALRYKGPDFEYSSQLPDWAKEDWVED